MLKRVEYQALLEQFNRRMGRPLLLGEGGAAPARAPAAPGFSLPQMPRLQVGRCGAVLLAGAAGRAAGVQMAGLGRLARAARFCRRRVCKLRASTRHCLIVACRAAAAALRPRRRRMLRLGWAG